MADDLVSREYAQVYEKHGPAWAAAFISVQGRGWNLLPYRPKSVLERNKIFLDHVKKGYAVHTENRYGDNYIYVLELPGTGVSGMYVSESRGWQDSIDSLRVTAALNFRPVIESVRKRYPAVPEKDVVDYIIKKYIGEGRLKKAVYKPENRLVKVWSISQTPASFLVEGAGIRNYNDLSFDPARIATLEKADQVVPEEKYHVEELKKIAREYRLGYADASTAIEDMIEVVERM